MEQNPFKMHQNEQELVKTCLTTIFLQNGYPDVQLLVMRDYEHISQKIAQQTGTLISISTLKRLLKGDFTRLPQVATLDALSHYLGYQNWQDFRVQNKAEIRGTLFTESVETQEKKRSRWPRTLSYSTVLGLLLLLFITARASLKDRAIKPEQAQFSCKKVTSNDIPNSVVFHYNVDGIDADSFFIQQSWDKKRRVQVYKKQYTLTDIYYEPGYHNAKLIADGQVIKTLGVSIPTKDWFFYAKPQFPYGHPTYLRTGQAVESGHLGLNEAILLEHHLDPLRQNNYVYTFFPEKWPVHSDNFRFRTRVRTRDLRQNHCPYLMLEVFCQKNFMYFTAMPPGCTSECKLQFGDQVVSGKNHDLSALGTNLMQWVDFKIEVKNRVASIYYGDRKVYSERYQQSSGLVTGLGFISNGLCEVDRVKLESLDGVVFYENDFEQQQ